MFQEVLKEAINNNHIAISSFCPCWWLERGLSNVTENANRIAQLSGRSLDIKDQKRILFFVFLNEILENSLELELARLNYSHFLSAI